MSVSINVIVVLYLNLLFLNVKFIRLLIIFFCLLFKYFVIINVVDVGKNIIINLVKMFDKDIGIMIFKMVWSLLVFKFLVDLNRFLFILDICV